MLKSQNFGLSKNKVFVKIKVARGDSRPCCGLATPFYTPPARLTDGL